MDTGMDMDTDMDTGMDMGMDTDTDMGIILMTRNKRKTPLQKEYLKTLNQFLVINQYFVIDNKL